jgi:DNA polymerase sigma
MFLQSFPPVKFVDANTGVECDINVNEQLGVLNTRMLKQYCDISPHLRSLLVAIKTWAKPLGLNNPSGKGLSTLSFSSYAFALMTIGFLQVGLRINVIGFCWLTGIEAQEIVT